MIPLSYADQVVEGSFEYALNEIVEEHLDLSVFEHRYRNDETGRSAYDPKVLLKVVRLRKKERIAPQFLRGKVDGPLCRPTVRRVRNRFPSAYPFASC